MGRAEREREFHNEAFSKKVRESVGKYYTITHYSKKHFLDQLLPRCAGKQALEYGCGIDRFAEQLAAHGAEVTGVDISDVAIEMARERTAASGLSGLRYLVMDAEHLEFDDGSFDLVFGSGILHHLDLNRAYAEISRVLNGNGTACFIEPLGHNPIINLFRRFTPRSAGTPGGRTAACNPRSSRG